MDGVDCHQGFEVTPKYLHISFIFKFCIDLSLLLFDDWMLMALVCGLLFMYGIPLGVNSQAIRYHAHFDSSRAPPEVYRICSQVLAAVCRLSHIVCSELSFQSLAYCCLSSTSPMIWSLYDKE